MNIFITGSTSFTGKHLLKTLLLLGHNMTILVRDKSNIVLSSEIMKKVKIHAYDGTYDSVDRIFQNTKFDLVVHLASLSTYHCEVSQVYKMIDSNINLGTFLLEAMTKYGSKKLINTSTYSQYNRMGEYSPTCLYAATKKAFEDIIEYYTLSGSIDAVSLTLYDVYGYDDHRNKVLATLLRLEDGNSIDMTKGEQLLHMIFIDDVVKAYLHALNMLLETNIQGHHIYGVYDDRKYTLKRIVEIFQEISGKSFIVNWGAKPYNSLLTMVPYLVRKLPGWHCKHSLHQGIERMIKYSEGLV